MTHPNDESLPQRRPTEIVSGIALAGAVYGFLTQAGVPSIAAAIIGIAIGFVPAIVTTVKDLLDA